MAILTALALPVQLASQNVDQHPSSCENSTVDDNYPGEFASQAKKFLGRLQAAVSNNNKAALALVMEYPVRVYQGRNVRKLKNRNEFIHNYSLVFTPEVRAAILSQSAQCLFANSQGVMIGDGHVWFTQARGDEMKIITFNLSSASSRN